MIEKENLMQRESTLPFRLPKFPYECPTVESYHMLIENTITILNNLTRRIEMFLENFPTLPSLIDEDLRSARGKIMVLSKNNLKMFRNLISNAVNNRQSLEDLSGFWAMVCLDLADIRQSIDKVEGHRLKGWEEPN